MLRFMSTEVSIITAIQAFFDGSAGTQFIVFCSRYAIFFFAFFLIAYDRKRSLHHAAREALWSALVAFLLAEVLSKLFLRDRPYMAWTHQVQLLVPPPLGTSFPSRHASISFAMACAIAYGRRSWGIAAFVLALIVAFGRVASGAHYPTDVLGGAIVGVASFGVVRWFHHAVANVKPGRSA